LAQEQGATGLSLLCECDAIFSLGRGVACGQASDCDDSENGR
jgi:hypothetical protein